MATVRYMLDTNMLSDLTNDPRGPAARHLRRVGESSACCSVVTAAELRYGAAKKGSAKLSRRVDELLTAVPVLPLPVGADRRYGALRATLERTGRSIGANDLLIASHALHEELVLVTDNVREFSRVNGLTIENWRAEP